MSASHLGSPPRSIRRAPALFIGHGSPMNAIEENPFTRTLRSLGESFPKPEAVVVISAHWLSAGTFVTEMPTPRTIHDFYGFPPELFAVEYPAPGSPRTAALIRSLTENPKIQGDDRAWGLDHGTWSILRHLYPAANVPVVQLSIDLAEPPEFHYDLGRTLRPLRDQGVMILGSGNIVHNLRQINWDPAAPAHNWAREFDEWVRDRIAAGDHASLLHTSFPNRAGRLSVPTADHYLPLLYALGAVHADETPRTEYEGIELGSVSLRSVSFGLA